MSQASFYAEFKSSIDTLMYFLQISLLGDYPNLGAADLDDVVQMDGILGSEHPALVWQIMNFEPVPRDPLWMARFSVGVKTTDDPSNYSLSDLMSRIAEPFHPEKVYKIGDWSGDLPPTVDTGEMYITMNDVTPQQFDHQSGVRLMVVEARVTRCV